MNFKTISIVATATITLGAGLISLAALKKSKQVLDDDERVKMMEEPETTVEEAIELQESVQRDMALIAQAPRVFKTYGVIALASAAVLTGLLISARTGKVEAEDISNVIDTTEVIEDKYRLDEAEQDFMEHAKSVASALGTTIKDYWMDENGNTMFELENPEVGEEFLDLITNK